MSSSCQGSSKLFRASVLPGGCTLHWSLGLAGFVWKLREKSHRHPWINPWNFTIKWLFYEYTTVFFLTDPFWYTWYQLFPHAWGADGAINGHNHGNNPHQLGYGAHIYILIMHTYMYILIGGTAPQVDQTLGNLVEICDNIPILTECHPLIFPNYSIMNSE